MLKKSLLIGCGISLMYIYKNKILQFNHFTSTNNKNQLQKLIPERQKLLEIYEFDRVIPIYEKTINVDNYLKIKLDFKNKLFYPNGMRIFDIRNYCGGLVRHLVAGLSQEYIRNVGLINYKSLPSEVTTHLNKLVEYDMEYENLIRDLIPIIIEEQYRIRYNN